MKRVILKVNVDGLPEVFSSLTFFYAKYPEFERLHNKISYRINRKKEPFKSANFTLYRCVINET